MQFLYDEMAGNDEITIKDESYRYIFKVRRHKVSEIINLRNLKDDLIYFYEIKKVSKKEALLQLKDKKELIVKPKRFLHIGWCIIEPKIIEKTLPMLNELGVGKISFIYCQRSQKNFRINLDRLKKILINSSQQCGRSKMMEMEIVENLQDYFERYPNSATMDFDGEVLKTQSFDSVVIGCEGGFSDEERKLFEKKKCYSFDTPMILRSESAVVAIATSLV